MIRRIGSYLSSRVFLLTTAILVPSFLRVVNSFLNQIHVITENRGCIQVVNKGDSPEFEIGRSDNSVSVVNIDFKSCRRFSAEMA